MSSVYLKQWPYGFLQNNFRVTWDFILGSETSSSINLNITIMLTILSLALELINQSISSVSRDYLTMQRSFDRRKLHREMAIS